jgi:hypothetical protein
MAARTLGSRRAARTSARGVSARAPRRTLTLAACLAGAAGAYHPRRRGPRAVLPRARAARQRMSKHVIVIAAGWAGCRGRPLAAAGVRVHPAREERPARREAEPVGGPAPRGRRHAVPLRLPARACSPCRSCSSSCSSRPAAGWPTTSTSAGSTRSPGTCGATAPRSSCAGRRRRAGAELRRLAPDDVDGYRRFAAEGKRIWDLSAEMFLFHAPEQLLSGRGGWRRREAQAGGRNCARPGPRPAVPGEGRVGAGVDAV